MKLAKQTKTGTGIANISGLKVKQYTEGFTALSCDLAKFNPQWMKDSGRSLAVVNPKPPFSAPEQFNEAASKDRRRCKKKVIGLWQNLVGDGENLNYTKNQYSVSSKISQDIPRICREKSREEYYLPLAFQFDGQPVGGSYFHAWEAGTPKQVQNPRPSVSEKPFKEFFTGGCLFGVPLYGIDQDGMKHSLTNPYYEIPMTSIMQSIDCPYDIHPDEILTRESLVNAIYMIKALGDENVVLRYHLPYSNYVIYGLNWFLKGNMTKQALAQYIELLKERVSSQKSYLQNVSENFDIQINCCTTLDSLGLEDMDSYNTLDELLLDLGVGVAVQDGMLFEELQFIRKELFKGILCFLQKQEGEFGEVWRHIGDKIENGQLDVSESDLLSLNYLDYSANLASSAFCNDERATASVLPSHESPVNHFYKKIFSEKFGAVTCFQWLAPLQVHDPEMGMRSFHLDRYIDEVNKLLSSGILKMCFMQSAAQALNSDVLEEICNDQINEIFSELENKKQVTNMEISIVILDDTAKSV